jgi:alkylation response protein AidB-like acyl-CoA dehydrogenase
VRVPVADRVGEEGQGWTIAKYLLGHERFTVGAGFGALARFTKQLRMVAANERSDGRPLIEDPGFRRRLAELEAEVQTIIAEGFRALSRSNAATELGFEASRIKLTSTRVQYELAELLMEAVGYYAQPHVIEALMQGWGNREPVGPAYAMGLAPNFFDWRKMRIGGGGSDEISHEILAKNVLRL